MRLCEGERTQVRGLTKERNQMRSWGTKEMRLLVVKNEGELFGDG
jgi:hypothetical protein